MEYWLEVCQKDKIVYLISLLTIYAIIKKGNSSKSNKLTINLRSKAIYEDSSSFLDLLPISFPSFRKRSFSDYSWRKV